VAFGRRDRITLPFFNDLFVMSLTDIMSLTALHDFSLLSHYFAWIFIASVIVRMTVFWDYVPRPVIYFLALRGYAVSTVFHVNE
jgi:hypothetical protein